MRTCLFKYPYFTLLTISVKAWGLFIAKSAKTFLLISILLAFKKSSPKSKPKLKLPASRKTAESKRESTPLPICPSLASAITNLIWYFLFGITVAVAFNIVVLPLKFVSPKLYPSK